MEEVKIVVVLKGSRATVGIQAPECDPIISLVKGDLDEILEEIPKLLERARARWAEAKTYPKCETELKQQPAAPVATQRPAGSGKRASETQSSKGEVQRGLF
jgi:hypothetical protein